MPKVSFPNSMLCSGKPHNLCRSFKSVASQIFSFLIVATVLFLPAVVFAQTDFGLSYGTAIGLGTQDIRETVARIIKVTLGILGILVTLIIIYGGYVWMTSGGNEQKVSMAKKIILNGVIGLVIIILSYALTVWIFNVIIGGTQGGGGVNQCTDGEIQGCTECVGGTWIYNSSLPGCTLPGADFRVKSIDTSHVGNDPAQEVYLCSRVQTQFSNKIDPNSVTEAVTADQLRVDTFSGNFSVAGNALTFKHDQLLAPFSSYQLMLPKQGNTNPLSDLSNLTLTLCDSIVGCSGGGTDPHFIWQFTTSDANDAVAPFITNTYPISDTTDLSYPNRNVSLSPILEANFSESIDSTSVADTDGQPLPGRIVLERLSGQNGSVDLTIPNDQLEVYFSGNGFRFNLINPNLLDAFRWYRITIQGVEDLCGNPMAAPKIWEFETNDSAPGVTGIYPTGTNQCTDVDVIINFGTSMYDSQVTFVITGSDNSVYSASIRPSLLDPGPYQVVGSGGTLTVADSGIPFSTHFKSFVFTPTNQWQTNTTYIVRVTTDLVINTSGGILEKEWSFSTSDPTSCACAPYITTLNPNEGMAGQCITIQGRCFTGTIDQPAHPTQVTINNQSTVIGGFGSNYLTTTVPDNLAVGTQARTEVAITYDNSALESITSNNNQTYYVNQPGIFAGPCLWSISPASGCGSPAVTLSGVRFGADPGTYDTNQNNVTFTANRQALNQDFTLWNDTTIQTKVPPATVDGNVFVTAGSVATNGIPFDIACGEGGSCTGDPNICDPAPSNCATNYSCNLSSCLCENSGGVVGDPCDGDINTPECNPNNTLCSVGLTCNATSCICENSGGVVGDPCDGDINTPECNPNNTLCTGDLACRASDCTCQNINNAPCDEIVSVDDLTCNPDNNLCAPDYICNNSSCLCEPGGSVGDPCDGDINTPECNPNNTLCSVGLSCNINSCECELNGIGDPCDADPATPQCEPNYFYCLSVGLVCDPLAGCTCQPAITPGTPPVIISTFPTNNQTNVCRNSMVEVVFDQKMDTSSIVKDSSFIVYNTDRMYNQEGTIYFYNLADGVYGCANVSGCTAARFFPSKVYQPNTEYIVTITNAVKSTVGLNMASDYVFRFTAGDLSLICKLDYVDVQPAYYLFTQTGETLDYVATPRAANNQAIVPLPGFYSWSWDWQVNDPDNILNEAVNDIPNIQTVSANPVNGRAELTATAEITVADASVGDTVGRQIWDTAEAETFICEYPWPATPPMRDSTGLEMKYCRGNDPNDLLGMLSDPASSHISFTNSDPDLVSEYLFNYIPASLPPDPLDKKVFNISKFENNIFGRWLTYVWHRWQGIFDINSKATAQTIEDVIGLRIYENPDMLGPRAWYESKSFPKGNPQDIIVDGFPAIKDGTSIYILGPLRAGGISAYIHVLSYNDLSSLQNEGIFDQLVKNIRFYTLTTVEKPRVARDFERIADATYIAGRVEEYKNQTGSYPNLAAGSFITGLSTSKWPSWQATLGNQLGAGLPTDPINKFTSYCSNDPALHCWQDADCGTGNVCLSGCSDGADPDTCWNEVTQEFSCPLGSSVYEYRLYGVDDFRMGVYLEETGYTLPDYMEEGGVWCDGQVYNSQGFCGDSIVQPSLGEECEIGEQVLNCPNNWASWYEPVYTSCIEAGSFACHWPEVITLDDCGGYCGDDIVQTSFGEVCDGQAGLESLGPATCYTDCSAFYCNPGYMLVGGVCVSSTQANVTITNPGSGTTGVNSLAVTYDNNQIGTIAYVVDNTVISTVANQSVGSHTYTFTNLIVGDHTLEVRLTVGATTVSDSIIYTVQGFPPPVLSVSILQPANNSSNGTDVTVSYSINPSGIVRALVDGAVVYTTGNNAGVYSYTFSNLSLGTHTLSIALQVIPQTATSSITYTATSVVNTPPTAPSGLTAALQTTPSPSRINLNWVDMSSDETQFVIQRSVNNTTSWIDYATVSSNVITYSDLSVSTGNTYYYRVRAENLYGTSAYSNTASSVGGALATIFVSSAYHDANFNTWAAQTQFNHLLDGVPECDTATSTQIVANCICTHLAAGSPQTQQGEYRAWISANVDGTNGCVYNAVDNFIGAQSVPLRKTDGTLVANSWNNLMATTILSPINRTETNSIISSSSFAPKAWTNTYSNGRCHTALPPFACSTGCGTYSCYAWSSNSDTSTFQASAGYPYINSNLSWVASYPQNSSHCVDSGRLYCVYYDNSIPTSYGSQEPNLEL